ncbi:MAG: hypothetical protein ACTSW8_00220, partial [Candidatus Thorarchaeota archaeon]
NLILPCCARVCKDLLGSSNEHLRSVQLWVRFQQLLSTLLRLSPGPGMPLNDVVLGGAVVAILGLVFVTSMCLQEVQLLILDRLIKSLGRLGSGLLSRLLKRLPQKES